MGTSIAARRSVPPGAGTFLVDTKDYGYFALIVAFGSSEAAAPFATHDPRESSGRDAFETPNTLRTALRRHGARYFVAQRANAAVARAVGSVVEESAEFVLVD